MTIAEPAVGAQHRVRVRELGIRPGVFHPGERNSITDVGPVRVGQTTLRRGENVRTGVTAVLPHGRNLFRHKVAGAVFAGNGFGKLAGSLQVQELGEIETPIVVTNTLSVGCAVEATAAWSLEQPGNDAIGSVNAVVGETNDARLNDIRGQHVTAADVRRAIETARPGPVREGSVGAGTGTICFGWKGGIGTSSRRLPVRYGGFTVGVLVQTNYGGLLTMGGVPVGAELGHNPYADAYSESASAGETAQVQGTDDGSCMIVVGTDAPLGSRARDRVAARGVFGLARTGASFSHGSGDIAVAFATPSQPSPGDDSDGGPQTADQADTKPSDGELSDEDLSGRNSSGRNSSGETLSGQNLSALFQATLEACEEAVYNSLCMATTVTGNGSTVPALPLDDVRVLLRTYRL